MANLDYVILTLILSISISAVLLMLGTLSPFSTFTNQIIILQGLPQMP